MAPRTRQPIDRAISRIAQSQHGVFTTRQALDVGASPDLIRGRIDSGQWTRIHNGVLAVAGAPATWRQRVMAAVLAAGPGAVASHRTAAALHRFEDIPEGPVEILTPYTRRVRRNGFLIRRTTYLPRRDVRKVDGIPVTSPERTLIDLAQVLSAETIDDLLHDCVRRRLVDLRSLHRRVAATRGPGRAGIGKLRSALDGLPVGKRPRGSKPQGELLRLIERAGLPQPESEYKVRVDRETFYFDFAFPEWKLAIELNSHAWHGDPDAYERDQARQMLLEEAGWRIVRVTTKGMRTKPEETITRITRALEERMKIGRALLARS